MSGRTVELQVLYLPHAQHYDNRTLTTSIMSATTSLTTTAEDAVRAPPPSVAWLQTLELGYDLGTTTTTTTASSDTLFSCCFACGVAETSLSEQDSLSQNPSAATDGVVTCETVLPEKKLSRCAKCQVACYCSKACQVQDWKSGGHRVACPAYARVGRQMSLTKPSDQQDARAEIFGRIRFYACPYAVHKAATLGRGFLFVQSDSTLACLSLPTPKDCSGRQMSMRWVLLHYLTLGEYDSEVCREDFELAHVRKTLAMAVESYDDQKEVVLLMRFRCGHVALGRAALVPDFRLCQRLGQDYYSESSSGALQLNLDDL